MLRKLMKYELKATGRILLPLYGALLVVALINKILMSTRESIDLSKFGDITAIISMVIYGCIMAAVFFVTYFVVLQRFNKNLLGDEGYLMNTLPLPIWKNISSKLLIGMFWSILSGIIAIISIMIIVYQPGMVSDIINSISEIFKEGTNEFGSRFILTIIEVFIIAIISFVTFTLMLYASMSLGHLASKRKVLCSFGAFIVLNTITSTVSSFTQLPYIISSFDGITFTFANLQWLLFLIGMPQLVFGVGYFIICNYVMKNKLNLE